MYAGAQFVVRIQSPIFLVAMVKYYLLYIISILYYDRNFYTPTQFKRSLVCQTSAVPWSVMKFQGKLFLIHFLPPEANILYFLIFPRDI